MAGLSARYPSPRGSDLKLPFTGRFIIEELKVNCCRTCKGIHLYKVLLYRNKVEIGGSQTLYSSIIEYSLLANPVLDLCHISLEV